LSYSAIGRELGMCEAAATNAVLHGECIAAGHRPIERDANGKITREGVERIRLMLRKGLKHRDIQTWCGVSAATITRERRRYEVYLKANGKAPLPPPGGGQRYSGVAITKEQRAHVEQLYLEGYGAAKVSQRSGVSRTHCLRIREKLIRRIKRRGECLQGCSADGRRQQMKDHGRSIPLASLDKLRALLLDGEPVARAARAAVVGGSTAYRVYHQLRAELAAEGKALPRKPWRGRHRQAVSKISSPKLPGKRWGIDRYRMLVNAEGKSHEEAVAAVRAEWAEQLRAMPFEERIRLQLDNGARIVAVVKPVRALPDVTLGGVATAALG
jgi:transposase